MIIDHAHADDDDEATPVKGAADNILDRTVTFYTHFRFIPTLLPPFRVSLKSTADERQMNLDL